MLEKRKEGIKILHGRNGKERGLPELLGIRVDGLCEETRTVDGFNGYYRHGHTCMPFRDTPTECGRDTLAERYENAISRIERITQAGCQVKVQWECEFEHPEDMKVEEYLPLRTRDALYGWRTEAMRLHYRVKEGEETLCRRYELVSMGAQVFQVPRQSCNNPSGLWEHSDYASERRTGAMHGAASSRFVSPRTPIQVQRPPIILPV